jgi:hypothetical protein
VTNAVTDNPTEATDAELVENNTPEPDGDDSVVASPEDEQKPETDSVVEKAPAKGRKGAKSTEVAKTDDKSDDVIDAEVVENPPDPSTVSAFDKSAARKLTAKLKTGLRNAVELVIQAYDGRIWIPLGYESWSTYLDSELGEYRVKLPAIERKELVRKMTEDAKMSSRAIASALGVDQKTVVNDRKELGGNATEEDSSDGTVKVPPAERVTGVDGVSRPAQGSSKPREVDLADRFTQQLVPADQALGELLALTTDERWEEFSSQVATRHRADLARMARTMAEVFKALPGNGD